MQKCHYPSGQKCFNPRSPCGERPVALSNCATAMLFQPTLPMRGATTNMTLTARAEGFQPTLPMRGATRFNPWRPLPRHVSTHAPHAGSDMLIVMPTTAPRCFNPRSPCGERLSIPVTGSFVYRFNPRSPCGERH